LAEIESRPVENGFSNASEHYAILSKKTNYVFIDRTGKWNKFIEIKKYLESKIKVRLNGSLCG